MTIDQRVADRLQGRSLAWRLGAATTAAIGDRADGVGALDRLRRSLEQRLLR